MGMDFTVKRDVDFCPHCKRKDTEELFYCGNGLFTEDITGITKENGQLILSYGSSQLDFFATHFENCKEYKGDDALTRLEAVRDVIRPEYYSKIKEALQEEGAYLEAWW